MKTASELVDDIVRLAEMLSSRFPELRDDSQEILGKRGALSDIDTMHHKLDELSTAITEGR